MKMMHIGLKKFVVYNTAKRVYEFVVEGKPPIVVGRTSTLLKAWR